MQWPRRANLILIGVALLTLSFIAAVPWLPGTSTLYHRWRMHKNYDAIYTNPQPGPGGLVSYWWGEAGEQYEYHREQLVRLGAAVRIEHKFANLKNATPAGRHFIRLCVGRTDAPPMIDFSSPHDTNLTPLEMTVWCDADFADAWRKFLTERDVPDYEARFIPLDAKDGK